MEFPSQITFAGQSKRWGQGVAFLEHRHAATATSGALGRRYLITRQQFEDVFAQENARPTEPINFGPSNKPRLHKISDGWYGALVVLEPVDGVPVLTFTSTSPPEHEISNAPSIEYLRTIATGLSQVHGLDMHLIVDRLRISEVIGRKWSHNDLHQAITQK